MIIDGSIENDRLELKCLQESNATQEYANWLSDPDVNQYLETRNASIEDLQEFIRTKNESDVSQLFGIFWKENGKHIGNVKLEPISWNQKTTCIGLLVGNKNYWGKGVATDVIHLLCDYAFNTLDLEEVTLGVLSDHTAAITLYEKCGFVIYKINKDAKQHDGVTYDQILMRKLRK